MGMEIILGILIVEGALIFAAMKMVGGTGAAPATAGEAAANTAGADDSTLDGGWPGGGLVEILFA